MPIIPVPAGIDVINYINQQFGETLSKDTMIWVKENEATIVVDKKVRTFAWDSYTYVQGVMKLENFRETT